MGTLNLTRGGNTGISENAVRKHVFFTNTIDFGGTHLVAGVETSNALTATDIGQLISIPAKFWMTTFGVRLDLVQGATATCVFGDAANADGWLFTAFDLDGTANDFKQSGFLLGTGTPDVFVDLYHPGKYYPVADTIDIDPGHVVDTAIISVFAAGYILP